MSATSSLLTRRHPHSLLPVVSHNPSLVQLLNGRITREMVDHVARHAAKCVCLHPAYASPAPAYAPPGVHSLSHFIIQIVNTTNISTATLLSCLIYFDRIRAKMNGIQHATASAMHRIFLATIIVTAKYLNDSAPKNSHWATFVESTHRWKVAEINTMERELLRLLDFDLRFSEEEACLHFAPFMTTLAHQASTRASAVDKVSRASRARAAQQTPSPTETAPQSSSASQSSSSFAQSVSKLAKRLSIAHIRSESSASSSSTTSSTASSAASSPIPAVMTRNYSSTCSSEAGSLIDDTGSSSGSSSGWTSSESDSETEDNVEPRVYSATAVSYGDYCPVPQDLAASRPKKPFILSTHRTQHLTQTRARKPSDTSSICTITARSPTSTSTSLSSFHSRRTSNKRAVSGTIAGVTKDPITISSSVTMPAIPRSNAAGGFLSRMWGAAKGQALGHEKSASMDSADGASALKRLVLVSSRSTSTRTGGMYNV